MSRNIGLSAGDYRLLLAPDRGGSIVQFDWRGHALMRRARGPTILDVSCFPLVPYCNRIAHGRFSFAGHAIKLSTNMPGSDHPHPLHGFGWQSAWSIAKHGAAYALLIHSYPGGEWPWRYWAEQHFILSENGLDWGIKLTNLGWTPMPCGFGLHPYFPRGSTTLYHGLHKAEWQIREDGIPDALVKHGQALDWWNGHPVAARTVDTVYADRSGPLAVSWPDASIGLEIKPSENLSCTAVYVPEGADFFCIEPQTHATNAINTDPTSMLHLQPGASAHASIHFTAFALSA